MSHILLVCVKIKIKDEPFSFRGRVTQFLFRSTQFRQVVYRHSFIESSRALHT
jgi:hypothetical protein